MTPDWIDYGHIGLAVAFAVSGAYHAYHAGIRRARGGFTPHGVKPHEPEVHRIEDDIDIVSARLTGLEKKVAAGAIGGERIERIDAMASHAMAHASAAGRAARQPARRERAARVAAWRARGQGHHRGRSGRGEKGGGEVNDAERDISRSEVLAIMRGTCDSLTYEEYDGEYGREWVVRIKGHGTWPRASLDAAVARMKAERRGW